jgi:hypothetical protein
MILTEIAELAGEIVGAVIYLLSDEHRHEKRRQAKQIDFVQILISDFKVKGVFCMAELKEGQKFNVTVAPKTAHGHPAAIQDGSGRWTSSDDAVVSVEQDPTNPLKAVVRGLDGSANESVVIEFRADADRSPDGVREIVGTLDVVCTTGDAAVVELTADTPTDDTPAAGGTDGGTSGTDANPGNVPADGSTETPSDSTPTEGTDTGTTPGTPDGSPPE